MSSKTLAALALTLSAAFAQHAFAAEGYTLRKVALEGEPAPGTSDTFVEASAVTMNASGQVGFLASLSSGLPASGAWVDTNGSLALRMRNADAAPGAGGSYSIMAGFPRIDAAGGLAVLAPVSGGTSPRGVFLATQSGDSALFLSGTAAPPSIGGTFTAGLADLQPFGYSPNGALLFRSALTDSPTSTGGLFLRDAGGALTALAILGGAAPGLIGSSYGAFTHPTLDAADRPAFAATLDGIYSSGLFADTGSGLEALALSSQNAPGTGGGSFADFLYPASASGAVAFLASVSGSAVTGGVFLADGGVVAVAVENQLAPGTGGATLVSVNAPPAIAGSRSVAISAGLTGGSASDAILVYDPDTDALDPAVLGGDLVPGVSSPLASFGHVAFGGGGAIAFVAELDDGRTGVFVATPIAVIPALPPAAVAALLLGLAGSGYALLRRTARKAA
jgi:hypothetical protein